MLSGYYEVLCVPRRSNVLDVERMHHVSKEGDCVDFCGGAICPRLASSDALSNLSHFKSYIKICAHRVSPHPLRARFSIATRRLNRFDKARTPKYGSSLVHYDVDPSQQRRVKRLPPFFHCFKWLQLSTSRGNIYSHNNQILQDHYLKPFRRP
jgi:hypothetical protein